MREKRCAHPLHTGNSDKTCRTEVSQNVWNMQHTAKQYHVTLVQRTAASRASLHLARSWLVPYLPDKVSAGWCDLGQSRWARCLQLPCVPTHHHNWTNNFHAESACRGSHLRWSLLGEGRQWSKLVSTLYHLKEKGRILSLHPLDTPILGSLFFCHSYPPLRGSRGQMSAGPARSLVMTTPSPARTPPTM